MDENYLHWRCESRELPSGDLAMTRMGSLRDINSHAVLLFGPYTFHVRQRLILDGDRPLSLGGRALDILQLLVERAGEVVSKDELIARVWPGTVVEAINLRVHIAALRRALGEERAELRYITHVPRQGYRFIAPVLGPATLGEPVLKPLHNLTARLTTLVGRDSYVASLVRHLLAKRFITLVGPGGVGKSTVALRTAELLIQHYKAGVWQVDAGAIDDPVEAFEQMALTGAPAQCHALLVLDNAEHRLQRCCELVEHVLRVAPHVSILVTSREPLQVVGETVLAVPALTVPPSGESLSVDEAFGYSAVQLFVMRARARQQDWVLREQDLDAVAELCGRLDGLPLAIELTACHIDTLGLVGLIAQPDHGLQGLAQGRRTAVERHRSLRATLDWSYQHLSPLERTVLQRLSVFRRAFTLAALTRVVACPNVLPAPLAAAVERLVLKSFLMMEQGRDAPRYCLFNTSRAYARAKCKEPGEPGPNPAWPTLL